ncbi:hypothetical protein ACHAWF_000169, partial [Thalassiosira exigua]
MRPIVCCAGTFMNCWSKWLDHQLQRLKNFVPTYVRDTSHILSELREIDDLPPHAYVFTADADTMYNNIDTAHAIKVISKWLNEMSFHPHFPDAFPLQAVKDAMKILMTNNIFEFGSLHFLQLLGTAMGTSAVLLPDFGKYFYHRHLCRFIDDIFAIWICDAYRSACCPYFDAFTAALNNFGLLKWT